MDLSPLAHADAAQPALAYGAQQRPVLICDNFTILSFSNQAFFAFFSY